MSSALSLRFASLRQGSSQPNPAPDEPEPRRRATDPLSPKAPCGKEGGARNGRRSSTSSPNPRRVRFDFQGVEVLPTSSPPISQGLESGAKSQTEAQANTSVEVPEEDDADEAMYTSLLDAEGPEDTVPRPKKKSSTQILRALSSKPLPNPGEWTLVCDDGEDSCQIQGKRGGTPDLPVSTVGPVTSTEAEPKLSILRDALARPSLSVEVTGLSTGIISDDDKNSDEDDFPCIGRKALKQPPPSSMSSGVLARQSEETVVRHEEHTCVGIDDSDIFGFENEAYLAGPHKVATKYLGEEATADVDPESLASSSPELKPAQGLAIRRPRKASTSMFARPIGSYKGAPLHFTPFERQRLYSGVTAKVSGELLGKTFSERLALEGDNEDVEDEGEEAASFDQEAFQLALTYHSGNRL